MITMKSQSTLFWPLLHVAEDDQWHDNNAAFEQVFDYLGITDADRERTYKKTKAPIMENRAQFALNSLRTAGLIERRRGQFRLSDSGRHLINEYDWRTTSHQVITGLPDFKKS